MKNTMPDSDQPDYRAKRGRSTSRTVTLWDRILIWLLIVVTLFSLVEVVIQTISIKRKELYIADLQKKDANLSAEIQTLKGEIGRLQAALEQERNRRTPDGAKDSEAK